MRSYYESMGKEDEIGTEACGWVMARCSTAKRLQLVGPLPLDAPPDAICLCAVLRCLARKAFAPAIIGMSGQIHADFLRLADKQMRSYYKSMGKKDKIGNEAFRWARAKVSNCNKTSVGRAIAFGCAIRCHLSVHSLAMPRSGSHGGSGGRRGVGVTRVMRATVPIPALASASVVHSAAVVDLS